MRDLDLDVSISRWKQTACGNGLWSGDQLVRGNCVEWALHDLDSDTECERLSRIVRIGYSLDLKFWPTTLYVTEWRHRHHLPLSNFESVCFVLTLRCWIRILKFQDDLVWFHDPLMIRSSAMIWFWWFGIWFRYGWFENEFSVSMSDSDWLDSDVSQSHSHSHIISYCMIRLINDSWFMIHSLWYLNLPL